MILLRLLLVTLAIPPMLLAMVFPLAVVPGMLLIVCAFVLPAPAARARRARYGGRR